MPTQSEQPSIEAHLDCGDSITVRVIPEIGAYRKCIHCDVRRRVVGHTVHAVSTPQPYWLAAFQTSDILNMQSVCYLGHRNLIKRDLDHIMHGIRDASVVSLSMELHDLIAEMAAYVKARTLA